MKIAQIAPPPLTVPPAGYGGIELVVALLADGLTDRGHDVTLFASGGSQTKADLVCPLEEAPGTENMDPMLEAAHVSAAYSRSDQFDVIHDHTGVGPAVGAMLGEHPPVVHTLHGPWSPSARRYYQMVHERIHLVGISENQIKDNPEVGYAGRVYNGINLDDYPFETQKDDYLLFLARSNPEKGPEVAIEVAKRAGMPLKMIVKKAEFEERQYWDEVVSPHLTGDEEVFDPVEDPTKFELLSRARALIFPIQWNEPFGLVMTEAMACGTPVLASPRGAALEVVDDGVTGFLREGVDEIVEALGRLDELSPDECRRRVAERFSVEAMVSGYENVFEQVTTASPDARRPMTSSRERIDA